MKILVTGGAGFIGSNLTDNLISQGHMVAVIDNYTTGRKDNLIPNPNLIIIEDTITNMRVVHTLFNQFRPEVVVHAAASYKNPDDWTEDANTNILGSINVVKASIEFKVERLIYFQTSLCYGVRPLEQPITLNHPLFSGGYSGKSSYAISKTAAEQYIELSGLDFISFRLANAYGPRNISGPIPVFYSRLTQGKKCYVVDTRRDFIFIDDLIEVVCKAIYGKGKRGYYHISTGKDFAIKEVYDCIVDALNLPQRLKDEVVIRPRGEDDAPSILLDPSKTQEDFDWTATTSLDVGIRKAIEYYKLYGVTDTYTHLKISEDK
ncbi:MAG: NAD-dependent epimerase/dehydratase family protein [Nitrososphaeria archaeon]